MLQPLRGIPAEPLVLEQPGPRVVSIRSVVSRPESLCEWHSHPFEELCLTTGDRTSTGLAGERFDTPVNALCYYRRGVPHAFWNSARQAPRFWVLHFVADPETSPRLGFLRQTHALWPLSPSQAAAFKQVFMRLFLEQTRQGTLSADAGLAWLQLLLIDVQRWAEAEDGGRARLADDVSPELLRMWQLVHDSVPISGNLTQRIGPELPNYDSLRHAFKATFGVSPKQMLLGLRMKQARTLLLQTNLSIKEIADLVGYGQQHELTRAFRKYQGVSPTEWRDCPFQP